MGDLWQKGYGFEEIRNLVNERYNLGYSLQDINDLFDPLKTQGKKYPGLLFFLRPMGYV